MSARTELVARVRKALEAEFHPDLESNRIVAALMRTPAALDNAAEAAVEALVQTRVIEVLEQGRSTVESLVPIPVADLLGRAESAGT
jgi:hypothetical protein